MSEFLLTLSCPSPDRMTVRADFNGETATTTHRLVRADIEDLVDQVRSVRSPNNAWRALSGELGTLLFSDAVGELSAQALEGNPDLPIWLRTPPEVANWPWEAARAPSNGRCPIADGAHMVRVVGAPLTEVKVPRRVVLVVPPEAGEARAAAVESATRHLAKTAGLHVDLSNDEQPLINTLRGGALIVHLDCGLMDGLVSVYDRPQPIEDLELSRSTWLAVLSGGGTSVRAAGRLHAQGVHLVVARQRDLPIHASAIIDRALYRSLATNATVAEAVARARSAVLRRDGVETFSWAAPVIVCSPGHDGVPAAFKPLPGLSETFEPIAPAVDEPAVGAPAVDAHTAGEPTEPPSAAPFIQTSYPDLAGNPGPLVPAEPFVRETIRRIKDQGAEGPEVSDRIAALRALGAGGLASHDEDGATQGAEARTDQLVRRLMAAIVRPDLPLLEPDNASDLVEVVAQRAAVHPRSVAQAARVLLSGRALWLAGASGVGKARLARALTDDLFCFYPLQSRAELAVQAPLHRAVEANWCEATDEDDTLGPRTRGRTQVLARGPGLEGSWRTYDGVWLLSLGAHHTTGAARRHLYGALSQGLIEAQNGETALRTPVPADFRVIFTGSVPPDDLPGWIPVVTVEPPEDINVEAERWLRAAELQLGPAEDGPGTLRRREVATRLGTLLQIARRLGVPMCGEIGLGATAYAAERKGHVDSAIDEALCLFLVPRLRTRHHIARALAKHLEAMENPPSLPSLRAALND